MNDTLCRGAWDKGCTDIMYMIIEYPNYPIISLLTQLRGNCVNMLWLRNSSFNIRIWTRILTTATQCVTIELRRPLCFLINGNSVPYFSKLKHLKIIFSFSLWYLDVYLPNRIMYIVSLYEILLIFLFMLFGCIELWTIQTILVGF